MDYSNNKKSNIFYGGKEEKLGIIIEENFYIVKFQSRFDTGFLNNHISEYIGSHIFTFLGEEAQETFLGTYDNKNVVVCKDFINREDSLFVPFNDVSQSSLEYDKNNYEYAYKDIVKMLKDNIKLTDLTETKNRFWNMYIIDALLGNFDRHGLNWGFIKQNNKYKLSPIFDNGSCLFPRVNTDVLINNILNNEDELKIRTYKYQPSQIKLNKNKSSYFEVISSLEFKECNEALKRIVERYNEEKIISFINSINCISKLQKEFYIKTIKYRFENILLYSYRRLLSNERKNNTNS
jgi:hypothetical protein